MGNLINKAVEHFSVMAFHAGELKTVTEADLKGHWSVFFFYPADFTFVCPTELEDLAEHYDQFKKLNCEIYSVSTDSAFVHKAWADASPSIAKIRYPMLADCAGESTRRTGVLKRGQHSRADLFYLQRKLRWQWRSVLKPTA